MGPSQYGPCRMRQDRIQSRCGAARMFSNDDNRLAAMNRQPPSETEEYLITGIAQAQALQRQGKLGDALAILQQLLATTPDNFELLHGIGILYAQSGQFEEALNHFMRAGAIQPRNAAVFFNQGKALQELQRLSDALNLYDKAIALNPEFAAAYNNRGNVLKDLRRDEEALASYTRAIALNPNDANAHNNRGAILIRLRRYDEALASLTKVLTLQPDHAGTYCNRGVLLGQLKRFEEALADYDRAIALHADALYLEGDRLHAQMNIGLWDHFDERVQAVTNAIERGIPASQPFPLLAVAAPLDILGKAATLYAAHKCPPGQTPLWKGERHHHDRIRLGYFSADFHNHATSYLMAELFERHDRNRFELYAFSFGPVQPGAMRQRLIRGFDHFFDVAASDAHTIAALAHRNEIDIAIDLKGYTQDNRADIFALRPAPVQVNYLGFPATMGTPCLDYILADPVVIPEAHFAWYSEKVVHLPHSYQPNDTQRKIDLDCPSRTALGLPETGFVFCCFNNSFKITPDVFSVWMRLLGKIEGSVLWLLESNDAACRNLRREAQQRGTDPARLVFAPRTSLGTHLARHRHADLFLDTFYYNAHTTASDALWAGLPVLTCLGNTFAGRVAASLLTAVGLPELITHNHEAYEALAVKLAGDPDLLAATRNKLAHQRLSQPLFNTGQFTRHIEAAYTAMWQRYRQGLAPESIRIPA